MLLKADRIADYLLQGKDDDKDPLIITPCPDVKELEKSGSASIDLRLGTWFVSLRQARMSHLEIDEGKYQPTFTKTSYVRYGGEFFLHPGSFVLGITLEWIRIPKDLGAYVIGKSSWGRRGLIIATAASVHPGFTGCLTLELTNVGEIPVSIIPGMKICQLCIHNVESSNPEYVDQSGFIGQRRPIVGKIELDPFAKKLANKNS